VTLAMPRSELAVALGVLVPCRFVPGSASATATVLKSAAAPNWLPGLAEEAVNVAPAGAASANVSVPSTSTPSARATRRGGLPGVRVGVMWASDAVARRRASAGVPCPPVR
jgi:hypothetical protein